VSENEGREVIAKISFGSPQRRHFLMRAVHELSVPKKAKQKDETESCDKCDEEFFPIHKVSLLRFLLNPDAPGTFIAKWVADVDPKFLSVNRSRKK